MLKGKGRIDQWDDIAQLLKGGIDCSDDIAQLLKGGIDHWDDIVVVIIILCNVFGKD